MRRTSRFSGVRRDDVVSFGPLASWQVPLLLFLSMYQPIFPDCLVCRAEYQPQLQDCATYNTFSRGSCNDSRTWRGVTRPLLTLHNTTSACMGYGLPDLPILLLNAINMLSSENMHAGVAQGLDSHGPSTVHLPTWAATSILAMAMTLVSGLYSISRTSEQRSQSRVRVRERVRR